jgi:hypothetical protein
MSESLFIEAVSLARSGRKAEARALFEQVLKADRTNEMAWLWYAECVDTPEDRKRALEACVRMNPQAQRVRLSLTALERTGSLADDAGLTQPVHVGDGTEDASAKANRVLTDKDQWVLSGAANVFTVSPDHIPPEEFERIEKRTEAFLLKNPDLKPVWSATKITLPEPVETISFLPPEPFTMVDGPIPAVMETPVMKSNGNAFTVLLVTLMFVLLLGAVIALRVV